MYQAVETTWTSLGFEAGESRSSRLVATLTASWTFLVDPVPPCSLIALQAS